MSETLLTQEDTKIWSWGKRKGFSNALVLEVNVGPLSLACVSWLLL